MKAKQQALVVMIPGFPKDESDTTCLPAQQSFVRALTSIHPGYRIIVLAFQYPFTASTYNWHQTSVTGFGGKNRGGLSRLLLWQRIRRHFRLLAQSYEIKGLLSFWLGECAYIGHHLASGYGIPHYAWLMGQDARGDNKYVRKISPLPGELIAISDFIAAEFQKNHGIKPAHIIPLGIEPSIYGNDTRQRSVDLLAVGSLIPLKRFEIFIRMVKIMRPSHPHIRAVICGNGPEESRLREMILREGLDAHIRLTGERSHADVIGLMKTSRILVHPSSYEGFSGVCLEALGAGAHVVSFTKPMAQDFEHWHVVADEEKMREKLVELLSASLSYEAVIPFRMEETVKEVMRLF